MTAALDALRDAGYSTAVLWTAENNTRARQVYERYGWKLDGATTQKTFVGVTFTELRYTIEL
jgi:ribosomal protein S18 acetylase RimI-like enzyme